MRITGTNASEHSYRLFSFGMVCVAAILAAGCVAVKRAPPAPPEFAELPAHLWICTSQGDAEKVTLNPQSNGSLEVTVQGKSQSSGKGAVIALPLGDWRIAPSSVLEVTAVSDADMQFAAALRTDQFYESPAQRVVTGNPQEFSFPLGTNSFKSARSKWEHRDTVNAVKPLQSIELVLYPAPGQARTIILHGVRLRGATVPPAPPPRSLQPLKIVAVAAPTTDVPRFGKFEVIAQVTTACSNPFDPAEITVNAEFISPSGRKLLCPGFFAAFGNTTGDPDEWRVRFSPDEAGSWTWTLIANTPTSVVVTKPATMTCGESQDPGPVVICQENPLFFDHADGSFYYPIGHNVCWNSLEEYREQFALMKENGENWSRVWVAPWNCEIEWSPRAGISYKGLGRYNLSNAQKLDAIVEAAEQNGIFFQLVLHEHCRMSARTNPEWQNNPYNKALGGPCEIPQEFLTHETARRLAKNRLRYIIARWGYSSSILAWELFNEADLGDDFKFTIDAAWHREMAEYLKSIDPHRHLVTTSYISNPNAEVLKLAAIDFTQSHIYARNLPDWFVQTYHRFTQFNKPHFIGEFGRGTADGIDAEDKTGRVLHSGIWAQFMTPDAGSAMSWWWYDLIHPNRLYGHFAALSRYAAGLDRRSGTWELQTGRLGEGNVLALVSAREICFWIYDPEILPWTDGPAPAPREIAAELTVTNLSDGAWTLEHWDTYTGEIVRSDPFVADNEVLIAPIRFTAPDAAFKLRRTDAVEPEAQMPRLLLEPWDIGDTNKISRAEIRIPSSPQWSPEIQVGQSQDGSFAFKVAHDGDALRVTVRVTDNKIMRQHSDDSLWKDDCVELWIDSRGDADFFKNTPHNPGCYQFVIAPSQSEPGKADTITYRHPEWNNKVFPSLAATSQIVPGGYVIEATIPLAALRGDKPVADPRRIGFNVSTCESDGAGGWKHLLWQGKDDWDARQWSVGILEQ